MDLNTRLETLAETRVADQSDKAELIRHQENPPSGAAVADAPAIPNGNPAVGAETLAGSEADRLPRETSLEAPKSGMVIGPAENRVRLLRDLSGTGRIWQALVVTPDTERTRGNVDELRAIKLFLPTSSHGQREVGRDERSLRADSIGWRTYLTKVRSRVEQAMKLDHPCIASIYGWRHGADGWPFAEMEFVDPQRGQSLAQLLGESGQGGLPWDTVLKWLRPTAMALAYSHQQHVPHQHFDAGAIFLTSQGTIKVLGFGLTTELREPPSVLFGVGEPAAEAAGEGSSDGVSAEAAFRSDVFALALLVYQMLMGQSAYEAKGQLANVIPRPPNLTDEAWRVLRRGLAYPSELCPVDPGKFMDALEAAQRATSQTGRKRAFLPRGYWPMVAGAGLLALLGLYWLIGSGDGTFGPNQPARLDTTAGLEAGSAPRVEGPPDAGLTVLLQEAEREADLRAFESAKRMDTLVAYQLYLQRCPRCGFEKETRNAMQNLQTEERIGKLRMDFETLARAFEQDNRDDRSDEALERLNTLATLMPGDSFVVAGRRRLALGWAARARASMTKGDLAGAWRGLRKAESIQPDLPELASLAATLKQAETTEQIKRTDADAFATARRANTRKAYWAYLERCSAACNYRAEAEAALDRLSPANPVMRDRLSDGSQGPELVVIPSGGFLMGSPSHEKGRYNDEQQHSARIAKSFAIGKYEVMFHEYEQFAAATGRPSPADQGWGRGRQPVINVSWLDAKAYAEWLSQQTGYRYRLPTETEWEYAVRAGTTSSRYWGDDPDQGCAYANAGDLDGKKVFVGWTVMQCHDGRVYAAPVGGYRSNDYGLHDMMGNVLEWTCSLYAPDYQTPAQSCEEPDADRQFVIRGGSWNDEPRNVRSADRHRGRPDFRDYFLGFRVVRELR